MVEKEEKMKTEYFSLQDRYINHEKVTPHIRKGANVEEEEKCLEYLQNRLQEGADVEEAVYDTNAIYPDVFIKCQQRTPKGNYKSSYNQLKHEHHWDIWFGE